MCGIAGWLGSLPENENYGARLVQALRHRGPDAHGIRSWSEATLVHTRLSIIDLSPTGAQPMANEDATIWTVFNGEIYNHRELRQDLERRGHRFRGHSDTEVLVHLYEDQGVEFVSKLRGMFALAIYDTRSRSLVLARDRFGIKPLFYAPEQNRLAFASEIGALLQLPGIDRRPNRQAIYDFAALFYIPAPETFYRGIRALQPGEIIEARLGSQGIDQNARFYNRWSVAPNREMTLVEATDRADALVTTAVRRQLESEVPLGALLSGGIDSSLVSVAAQAALRDGLRTFNVRFPEKEYDETWAAQAVAKQIGSHHLTLEMNKVRGSWDHVTSLLQHAGQPFADTSLFAVNAVCRLMRQHVTVALSGDGGDEGFGGYDFYWQIAKIAQWQTLPTPFQRATSIAAAPLAHFGAISDRLPQRLRDLAGADDISVMQNLLCWIREEEHQRLCLDTNVLLPVRRLFEPKWGRHLPQGASRLERLSALATEVNTRLTLANDYLFKVDTASMKESLEIRVPLLDEDLFSFGLSLPHHLKVNKRTGKRILRKVAERRLPIEVASKPKRGFCIAVDRWIDEDFKSRLKEVLVAKSSRLVEFFRPEVYRPMVEAFCEGYPCPGVSREGLYQRIVMLLSVQSILDRDHPLKVS